MKDVKKANLTLVPGTPCTKESSKIKEKEELFLKFAPLISKIALNMYRRVPKSVEYADIYGCAILGFLDAVDKYDPTKNCKFESYAMFRIRGAIIDGMREQDHLSRSIRRRINKIRLAEQEFFQKFNRKPSIEDLARHCLMTVNEVEEVQQSSGAAYITSLETVHARDLQQDLFNVSNPLNELARARAKKQLHAFLKELEEVQRTIMELYYFHEKTFREISEKLNLEESRVYYLHTQALNRMKKNYQAVDVEEPIAA